MNAVTRLRSRCRTRGDRSGRGSPAPSRVAVLVVMAVFLWFTFDAETRDAITPFQRGTVIALGAAMLAALFALVRSRVVAEPDRLTVVNGYRRRDFEWAEVIAVRLPPGAPWVTLDLADGNTVPAMGIQSLGRGPGQGRGPRAPGPGRPPAEPRLTGLDDQVGPVQGPLPRQVRRARLVIQASQSSRIASPSRASPRSQSYVVGRRHARPAPCTGPRGRGRPEPTPSTTSSGAGSTVTVSAYRRACQS